MAVFRVEKTRDYTIMSNYHLKDWSLSLKSKGLLSMMLSLPDEQNYTTRNISALPGMSYRGGGKSRMLKLGQFEIEYVFESLDKNTTKVRNIKTYILTALYNAPITMISNIGPR